ncbi:phosphoethanolamine--lipid A transferase [Accumulibacter sp.]|uniref:phosphoethanolamine transferase n=1 Tax=Accumulibacter sp. TaxID=2053492 RepID=UPI00262DD09D|nr:phosphoethanolamine--lipid A transferase [Accumulibacter sp.]
MTSDASRLQSPPPGEAAVSRQAFVLPATVEQLLWVASVFWTLTANRSFFGAALKGRALTDLDTWSFVLALGMLLVALHFLLLAILANRWTVKPLLAVLLVATALATHFMQVYGVYLDPSMLRNVIHTDFGESRELFSWDLLPQLMVYAGLPLLLLWRVEIVHRRRVWSALGRRLAALLLAAVAVGGASLLVFKPLSSLLRNHKEVRYLVTPANFLWSLASVTATEARGATVPRQPIGLDAVLGPGWEARRRPMVVVLVVGETVRAANWGLNGYARQTTPELARQPLISFADVTSCGTNTEVSVPCLFAPVGRRAYDAARISGSESLLHVLARAGVGVHWRDNQSGCKGVCDGLSYEDVMSLAPPGLCANGRCLDAGLLHGLDERLAKARGTQFLVLHQLGNHGPAYFRRYPPAFARFQPACENDDLNLCSPAEIVNAFDNALLYTDHVLASLIAKLQAQADKVDTALIYVSDHGESLGENQLFLHGVPYAIAPQEQTRVPMFMWFSEGLQHAAKIDTACLQRRARQPVSHDHLFHTLIALFDVRTALYENDWDLLYGCRSGRPVAS